MNREEGPGIAAWERARFDALLEGVLAALPDAIRDLLEEAPLVVDDAPSNQLLRELGMDPEEDDLCGLHSGMSLMERGPESAGAEPESIHMFRRGVIDQAGGWDDAIDEEGNPCGGDAFVTDEIRITLLHEIGHHFGLSEEDLDRLGYG